MHIHLLGINHKTASVDIREKLALPREALGPALKSLGTQVDQAIILSTCNRTEIYSATSDKDTENKTLRKFWRTYLSLDIGLLGPYLYDYHDIDAARHLFRVASGLDSQILGEYQILGQVRDSLTTAAKHNTISLPISRLFHYAIATGRRVRNETEVSRGSLSISYTAVQLARRLLSDLSSTRILLVGAGDTGELVAKALRSFGVGDILVANRTATRSQILSNRLNAIPIPFNDIENALLDVGMVITSTESPKFLITKSMLQHRSGPPLVLIDLALPRNVDPAVAELPETHLYNLDDLSAIAEENLENRASSIAQAEQIIEEELAALKEWWDSLEAIPAIKAIMGQAERIRLRELKKALSLLPNLTEEEAQVLEKLTLSLANKLLHNPIKTLKKRSPYYIGAAQELFQLAETKGQTSKNQ